MPLNFSFIESYIADHEDIIKDRFLLRNERYRLLSELGNTLQSTLKDYEIFETEFRSLVLHKIDGATSFEELRAYHDIAVAGIENFYLEEESILDTHDLFRIVRDKLITKVLTMVEKEMEEEGMGKPPTDYVWGGLGSEGRDEQTMITDQDNMIIYEEPDKDFMSKDLGKRLHEEFEQRDIKVSKDGPGPKQIVDYYYEIFCRKATNSLHEVGFERCKGNVMPTNEKWRGSTEDWKKRIEDRITYEQGIFEALDVIILTDARSVKGNVKLLDSLLEYFFKKLTDNKHVMKDFIQSAVLMPSALTFFGGFKTEKEGANKDKFNIKLLGWAPLILAVRMVALVGGIYERNTLRRIQSLRKKNIIKKDMETDLVDAYFTFVRFRIMSQVNYRIDNTKDKNYLKPDMLGPDEQERLRKAMKTVEAFQKYIQETQLFGQML
ncbi:MAG TPA: putative nucleotidyltransferase substrate binding domain-containing protein [Syntrophorhabdaceae bacterium]|nr:putative nucleotidyltransferase substrate binding domain-containing protein [Syntrophorhabdaceae bacterium]HNT68604.1 putative nucleotidyltransferase substrate binding domain-containing protein [Syntrophorhabdaceae bacterium]